MTNKEFLESITLEGEEWRDVVGFENAYMVSNLGRVVSLSRFVKCSRGLRQISARLLKVTPDKDGYLCVYLTKDNYDRQYSIHRLVALSFVENPNPQEYTHVDHINGNILNNTISNLRWCTMRMNLEYKQAYSNFCKAMQKRFAINPANTKAVVGISISNPNDIREYKSITLTSKDGFNPQLVCKCCRGQYTKHFGFRWMYLSDYKALISKSKNS